MKIAKIALLFIIKTTFVNAQEIDYKNFNWEKEPKLHVLNATEAALPEIDIYKEMVNEFAFEGENLYSFYFFHAIVKVNSDDAIEGNNKIYIPTGGSTIEVLETKARVINSNGKVIELNKNDIKEAIDEESKKSYQYFALDGIDKGSEVEYYYLLKRSAEMSGIKMNMQNEIPNTKLKFAVIAPSHLVFDFKSYNGFPEMQKDTTQKEKNKWYVETENISALKDETYSAYKSEIQSVIYKLNSNKYTGKNNLYSYSTVAQNYYSNVNKTLDKKAEKGIKALLKELKINDQPSTEKKIRVLEQFIKTHFAYQSFSNDNLNNIEFILANKIASKLGLMRVYAACFNELDIKYNLVLTSDRYENRFDKDFESYSFLEDELFYFPELELYMAPIAVLSRLGYIPSVYTNNYALFIKPVTLGEFSSALGKVQFIEALPHEKNSDTMAIKIVFNTEVIQPEISFTKTQMGLEVQSIQPIYDFIEGETEEEADKSVAKFINQDIEVEDVKIENKGGANFGVKPFKISAKLKETDFFVEKAGTKYLFKIGDLIGAQMEMYQDEERKLDVEMNYNHSYYRTISFNIPEGYQIKNLDDLKFDVSYTYNNKKSAYFVANYEIKGNTVTMTNVEVYDAIWYPKTSFDSYRKVINAAADFNKVTLILEKI